MTPWALVELDPSWMTTESGRSGMGIMFDCPHCGTQRLGIWFANPLDGGPPGAAGLHAFTALAAHRRDVRNAHRDAVDRRERLRTLARVPYERSRDVKNFFARYSKAIVGAFSGESLAQIISGAAAALGHPLPPIASVAVQILAPVVSTVLAPANATPPAP